MYKYAVLLCHVTYTHTLVCSRYRGTARGTTAVLKKLGLAVPQQSFLLPPEVIWVRFFRPLSQVIIL